MVEFEVVTANGFLGEQAIAAGDTRKYHAQLDGFLDRGEIITGVTATVTSSMSTVSVPTLADDAKSVFFFVTSTLTREIFTLALRIVTSAGQTLNYTCIFGVSIPIVRSLLPNFSPAGP